MATRGRKPDLKRRGERERQALKLRHQGLTLADIAHRLRMSKTGVHQFVARVPRVRPIHCRECERLITRGEPGLDNVKKRPLCLRCLSRVPAATFGERLRALRLARGWSRERLARAAGLTWYAIRNFEREVGMPRYTTLVKLARVLGPGLVGLAG